MNKHIAALIAILIGAWLMLSAPAPVSSGKTPEPTPKCCHITVTLVYSPLPTPVAPEPIHHRAPSWRIYLTWIPTDE